MTTPQQQDPLSSLGLDEESVSVEIPRCMDVVPDVNGGKWTLNLYADGCLNCSELVQDATDDYSNAKCHYNQGNQYCPAFEVKVAFIGPKVLAIKRIKAAQEKGDSQAVLRQLMKLTELSETDRRAILAECGLSIHDPQAAEPELLPPPADAPVAEGEQPTTEASGEVVPPLLEEEVTEVDC